MELMSIESLAPQCLDMGELFGGAVSNALSNILDGSTSKALEECIGKSNLQHPELVFETLDEILGHGSKIVKGAINEEFKQRVHSLYVEILGRMKANMIPSYPETGYSKGEATQPESGRIEKVLVFPAPPDEKALQPDDQDLVVSFVRSATRGNGDSKLASSSPSA